MKIRNGFVSNSSSSSYICEVCGETFEAYDQGISDFGLVMCKDQDHLFCESHSINPIMVDKDDNESYTTYDADVHGDGENRIDSIHCPICQMKTITSDMMLRYALKKLDTKIPDIKKEMASKFKNIGELDNFISCGDESYEVEFVAQVVVVSAQDANDAVAKARAMVAENPVGELNVTHLKKK